MYTYNEHKNMQKTNSYLYHHSKVRSVGYIILSEHWHLAHTQGSSHITCEIIKAHHISKEADVCKPAVFFQTSANIACRKSAVALFFVNDYGHCTDHMCFSFCSVSSVLCHNQFFFFPLRTVHNEAKTTCPHLNSFSKHLFTGCCISWHTMFYITKHEMQLPSSHFHTCQLHDLKIGETCQVRGREGRSREASKKSNKTLLI